MIAPVAARPEAHCTSCGVSISPNDELCKACRKAQHAPVATHAAAATETAAPMIAALAPIAAVTAPPPPAPVVATWFGTIYGEGVVMSAGELELEGRRIRRGRGDQLALWLDDLRQVTVMASAQALDVHPVETHAKRWGALVDDPRAPLFADVAPGDHVGVKLTGWTLRAGQRIAVRGVVSGGVAQPATMDARRVVIADGKPNAEVLAELDRRDEAARASATAPVPATPSPPAAPRRPWQRTVKVLFVIGAVLAIAGVVSWQGVIAANPQLGPGLLLGALQFFTIALALELSYPPFELKRAHEGTFRPAWGIGLAAFMVLTFGLMAVVFTAPIASFQGGKSLVIPIGYAGAAALGFLLWDLIRHRKLLRFARLVLTAPAASSLQPNRSCRFRGTVEPGSTPIERTVSYIRRSKSSTRQVRTKDGGTATETTTTTWIDGLPSTTGQSFAIRSDPSTVLTIVMAGADWGAPAEILPRGHQDGLVVTTRSAILPGDDVLVLGRPIVEPGGTTVRATGPESLLVFAARSNARGTLLRFTAMWLFIAAALLAIVVGSAIAWLTIG